MRQDNDDQTPFCDYLRGYGYSEAAGNYDLLAEEYNECRWLSEDDQKTRLNSIIRLLEFEARTLF